MKCTPTTTSVIATQRGPVLASSGPFLVNLEGSRLVLWAAGQQREVWLRAGRLRPLPNDWTLELAIREAFDWLRDLERRADENLEHVLRNVAIANAKADRDEAWRAQLDFYARRAHQLGAAS